MKLARVIQSEIIPRLFLTLSPEPQAAIEISLGPSVAEPTAALGEQEISRFVSLLLSDDDTAAYARACQLRRDGVSVDAIFLELLAPAARRLGTLWETDECSFFEVTRSLGQMQVLLRRFGQDLGFPVILKSLYGGGGRGMKVAFSDDQLRQHFASVSSEASAAFGRSEIYIEHYITAPRHLEVQVLADAYGNIRIYSDRECSIQRRHQKIIEEAPIPSIDADLRQSLWDWSKGIIQAIGFKGLGTVEFLMDQEGGIYFLEINGRLQVEHPVTEMISGIDLVREQIMVAAGARIEPFPVITTGHAIECRINAENTSKNFMPTTGTIARLRLPSGPGTRVDTHLFQGCIVTPFYDPLLVKLIAHHTTRNGALRRMGRMLDETVIDGLTTNKELLYKLLNHDSFLAGNGDTSLVTQLLNK
jgi:acetyl-CoA carboxylase biotin carboxylase subunit